MHYLTKQHTLEALLALLMKKYYLLLKGICNMIRATEVTAVIENYRTQQSV